MRFEWDPRFQITTILTETITSETKHKSQDLGDLLCVALPKRKRKDISGNLLAFVVVASYCGLCVPNMFLTKANAKENLGRIYLPCCYDSESEINLQIFICNRFRADESDLSFAIGST